MNTRDRTKRKNIFFPPAPRDYMDIGGSVITNSFASWQFELKGVHPVFIYAADISKFKLWQV